MPIDISSYWKSMIDQKAQGTSRANSNVFLNNRTLLCLVSCALYLVPLLNAAIDQDFFYGDAYQFSRLAPAGYDECRRNADRHFRYHWPCDVVFIRLTRSGSDLCKDLDRGIGLDQETKTSF